MERKKKLIFVVDDDVILRNAISRYLDSRGYDVKSMEDGFNVLLLCEYLLPDLIISDIRMPKLDGITLLQGLRNRDETKKIPVIFMSAYGQEDIMNSARELGADFFLIKPFPMDYLDDLVRHVVVDGCTINQEREG